MFPRFFIQNVYFNKQFLIIFHFIEFYGKIIRTFNVPPQINSITKRNQVKKPIFFKRKLRLAVFSFIFSFIVCLNAPGVLSKETYVFRVFSLRVKHENVTSPKSRAPTSHVQRFVVVMHSDLLHQIKQCSNTCSILLISCSYPKSVYTASGTQHTYHDIPSDRNVPYDATASEFDKLSRLLRVSVLCRSFRDQADFKRPGTTVHWLCLDQQRAPPKCHPSNNPRDQESTPVTGYDRTPFTLLDPGSTDPSTGDRSISGSITSESTTVVCLVSGPLSLSFSISHPLPFTLTDHSPTTTTRHGTTRRRRRVATTTTTWTFARSVADWRGQRASHRRRRVESFWRGRSWGAVRLAGEEAAGETPAEKEG